MVLSTHYLRGVLYSMIYEKKNINVIFLEQTNESKNITIYTAKEVRKISIDEPFE